VTGEPAPELAAVTSPEDLDEEIREDVADRTDDVQ
jgi:hypothetical protein